MIHDILCHILLNIYEHTSYCIPDGCASTLILDFRNAIASPQREKSASIRLEEGEGDLRKRDATASLERGRYGAFFFFFFVGGGGVSG